MGAYPLKALGVLQGVAGRMEQLWLFIEGNLHSALTTSALHNSLCCLCAFSTHCPFCILQASRPWAHIP